MMKRIGGSALMIGIAALSVMGITAEFQFGLNGNNTARFRQIRDGTAPEVKNLPGMVLVADG